MRSKILSLAATLAAALLLLPGCVKLGPDHAKPQLDIAEPPAYQHADGLNGALGPNDHWWRDFELPQVDQAVQEVLARNLDLKQAAAVVLQQQAVFVQTRSQRFPTVEMDGTAAKNRSSGGASSLPAALGGGGRESESYNLSMAASFEVDLWGRLARSEEASRAALLAAEENQRTVAQTVVAAVVTNLLTQRALVQRLEVAQKSLDSYQKSLAVVDGRYRRGLVGVLDVRQARRALAQAEASVPSLRQELGVTQQALAVLLGRFPTTNPAGPPPGELWPGLRPVPPGLPSELLARRPDVRSAEATLAAASAQIGAARAARFPTIRLTGSWGYSSTELSSLVGPTNELWALAAGLSQPVFNAGRLAAAERQARAAWQEKQAAYAKTVLTAFSEVEKALLTRQEQMVRRERLKRALVEAKATLRAAADRYQRGLVDYLTVLESQQTRFTVEDNLVQNELALLTNRVTLYRSLGGGWAQTPPPTLLPMVSKNEQ